MEVSMFKSYDMSALGTYLKNLRKSLNLTQKEVSKKGMINIDTLRRIENGYVMPKYETIETLSIVYRVDLLLAFSFLRTSSVLYELYRKLDKAIVNYNVEMILEIKLQLDTLVEYKERIKLVNINEIRQLEFFIEGIEYYYSNSYGLCIEKLIDSIKITNEQFDINIIKVTKMNVIESRILLLISLCLTSMREHSRANELMLYNLKQLTGSANFSVINIQLIIKLYFNISYNFYNLQNMGDSIKFANKGIKFCKDHDSIYCLHLLYYRRGIAKFKMGNNGYKNDLKVSVYSSTHSVRLIIMR